MRLKAQHSVLWVQSPSFFWTDPTFVTPPFNFQNASIPLFPETRSNLVHGIQRALSSKICMTPRFVKKACYGVFLVKNNSVKSNLPAADDFLEK